MDLSSARLNETGHTPIFYLRSKLTHQIIEYDSEVQKYIKMGVSLKTEVFDLHEHQELDLEACSEKVIGSSESLKEKFHGNHNKLYCLKDPY